MRKLLACVAVAGSVLFGAGVCSAESVQHQYAFDGDVQVWDVSGTYTEGDLSMSYTLAQDAKGKISGFGSAFISEDGVTLNMDFIIKGSVKGKDDVVAVKFAMKCKGSAYVDYYGTLKFSASFGMDVVIDNIARQMVGTVKMRMNIAGYDFSETEYFSESLPVGMDGSMDLDVDLQAGDKGVAGTGTVTLSNGQQFNYLVKGKVSAQKGTGSLSLKGDGASKGSSFKIETDANYNLTGCKAKLMGQSVEL